MGAGMWTLRPDDQASCAVRWRRPRAARSQPARCPWRTPEAALSSRALPAAPPPPSADAAVAARTCYQEVGTRISSVVISKQRAGCRGHVAAKKGAECRLCVRRAHRGTQQRARAMPLVVMHASYGNPAAARRDCIGQAPGIVGLVGRSAPSLALICVDIKCDECVCVSPPPPPPIARAGGARGEQGAARAGAGAIRPGVAQQQN